MKIRIPADDWFRLQKQLAPIIDKHPSTDMAGITCLVQGNVITALAVTPHRMLRMKTLVVNLDPDEETFFTFEPGETLTNSHMAVELTIVDKHLQAFDPKTKETKEYVLPPNSMTRERFDHWTGVLERFIQKVRNGEYESKANIMRLGKQNLWAFIRACQNTELAFYPGDFRDPIVVYLNEETQGMIMPHLRAGWK